MSDSDFNLRYLYLQSYALDNTCVPGLDRSFVDESPNYK